MWLIFLRRYFKLNFIHGIISKHTYSISKILFCSNNTSYNLEDATTLFMDSKDIEWCSCLKKFRATLCTKKQTHHNSKQHRDCIMLNQMNRCLLQSDSITITETQKTCHFILLNHFEALDLVFFYPFFFLTFFFFCDKTTWNHYGCIVFLFLCCITNGKQEIWSLLRTLVKAKI